MTGFIPLVLMTLLMQPGAGDPPTAKDGVVRVQPKGWQKLVSKEGGFQIALMGLLGRYRLRRVRERSETLTERLLTQRIGAVPTPLK